MRDSSRITRATSSAITIDAALTDQQLLGAALGDPATWQTWLAVLKATFGLPLDEDQQSVFASVAGGRAPPTQRVRELWAIVGRRGGKSRMAAALAVYLALFPKYRLSSGERGMVLVLSASQDQSRAVFAYCLAFLKSSPVLRKEVIDSTRSEIRLRNGICIAIHSNSFRTIRGRTLCAAVLDEVAFWRDETSATPDTEAYTAVMGALLTTAGMLIGISTGYRRTGLLYAKHREYFGVNQDDTLVVQGSTQQFNATVDDRALAAQMAADPAAVESEWCGGFRSDIASFLDDATIDAAIEYGRPLELPPLGHSVFYRAYCDASGGVGADAYTVAIGHREGDITVIDLVRGTTGKYDPHEITRCYAALLKEYGGITTVTGDYYAAEWVGSAWRDAGITYVRSTLPKSEIYREAIPLFTRHLIRLPDHATLLRELRLLELQAHRNGKEVIDHPKNGHDDYANVVCGVCRVLTDHHGHDNLDWVSGPDVENDPDGAKRWQAMRLHSYVQSFMAAATQPIITSSGRRIR